MRKKLSSTAKQALIDLVGDNYDIDFGEVELSFKFNNRILVLMREKVSETTKVEEES